MVERIGNGEISTNLIVNLSIYFKRNIQSLHKAKKETSEFIVFFFFNGNLQLHTSLLVHVIHHFVKTKCLFSERESSVLQPFRLFLVKT